jgi:hypothetical protein
MAIVQGVVQAGPAGIVGSGVCGAVHAPKGQFVSIVVRTTAPGGVESKVT